MFSGGSATEVFAYDEYFCGFGFGCVEDVGEGRAVFVESCVIEKIVAHVVEGDFFEEACRGDLIGVDVVAVDEDRGA